MENSVIPSEAGESTHFVNTCSEINAKIPRLAFGSLGMTTALVVFHVLIHHNYYLSYND